MGNPKAAETAAALRMLPSTDDLLSTREAKNLVEDVGIRRLTTIARAAIDTVRRELVAEISTAGGRDRAYSKESLLAHAAERLGEIWAERHDARLRSVINATGVVIHTNLGRAPLSDAAIRAIADAAGYCNLEYDLPVGKRGRRGANVESAIAEVTGAEAALVVNNCAAAAFLVLSVFAKGGEVIVSRGELVEIGGDFRIPDVLVQSGASLREVGTTNRTKLSDYERSISDDTRLLMSVHPSNYRIVGFTQKPSRTELADLAHANGILLYEDAGSGAFVDLSDFGLNDEPLIPQVIAERADIVTFSGDKLLGGSQAGIVVGRRDLVEQMRRHPLYRALRVDKLIYAALEATLEAYQKGAAKAEIPVLRMLAETKDEVETRTRDLARRLNGSMGAASAVSVEILDGESVIGGGAAPAVPRPTVLLSLRHQAMSAVEIEEKLRLAETPIIARIEDERVLLDLRTVDKSGEERLADLIPRVLEF